MASKKCPNCSSDCPVASGSCKKCLHVFKSRKGSSNSFSSSGSTGGQPASASVQNLQHEDTGTAGGNSAEGQGRRHTGRITRSKPNFYDSLHVEEQMRQQKLLLRKQLKQSKSEEDGAAGVAEEAAGTKEVIKTGEPEAKKRRRGRPPAIGVKPNPNTGRITIHNNRNTAKLSSHSTGDETGETLANMKDEDIMSDITPEKALQYNIVLDEINRKWVSASWKVS